MNGHVPVLPDPKDVGAVQIVIDVLLSLLLGSILVYLYVFRHPVVRRLQGNPRGLLDISITEVVTTDRVLRRARKLNPILQEIQVPLQRWSDLVRVAHGEYQRISTTLGALPEPVSPTGNGLHIMRITMPPLMIRIESNTAIIIHRQLLTDHLDGAVKDTIVTRRLHSKHVIVLDVSLEQKAQTKLEGVSSRICVLNEREIVQLMLSADPRFEISRSVARTASLSDISPYQTGFALENPSLFVGRTSELARLGGEARNHLLVGARQMGKSSILKALVRRAPDRAHYVPLTGADIEKDLAQYANMSIAGLAALPPSEAPPMYLFDEADTFVRVEGESGYPVLRQLRAIAESGSCKFVFAGYWQLHRAASFDQHSPIRNFAETLQLEPLDPESARILATRPLAPMGVRWDSDATVTELIKQTGCRPNLVAIACNAAVKAISQSPDRIITWNILRGVLDVGSESGRDLASAMEFLNGLGDNPDQSNLDLIVLYSVLDKDSFARADIQDRLEAAGANVSKQALSESIMRLELSYVVLRKDNAFRWPVPLVRGFLLRECEGRPERELLERVREGRYQR